MSNPVPNQDLLEAHLGTLEMLRDLHESAVRFSALMVPVAASAEEYHRTHVEPLVRAIQGQEWLSARLVTDFSDLGRASAEASRSLARLMGAASPARKFFESYQRFNESWQKAFAPIDHWREFESPLPGIESHLAEAARFTQASQMLMATAQALQSEPLQNTLAHLGQSLVNLGPLGLACADFYRDATTDEETFFSLPPDHTLRPAAELFTSLDLAILKDAQPGVNVGVERERRALRASNAESTRTDLTRTLESRFPDLLPMALGAREVLSLRGHDYQRHYCASLRELFTHVLHRLAPDRSVREFTHNPADFHDGRPTRAARISYVCRSARHDSFREFVKKDIAAMQAMLDAFQAGTHRAAAGFKDEELDLLGVRLEGALLLLLSAVKE